MGLRHSCFETKQLHYELFLQERRLIELLTHAIPYCNVVKFPSVNLGKTAISHYYSIFNLL